MLANHARVAEVIRKWVGLATADFTGDENLETKLLNFLDDLDYSVAKADLRKYCAGKIRERRDLEAKSDSIYKSVLEVSSWNFKDMDPGIFAQQLSLLEFNLLKNIRVKEFMRQAWNKDGKGRSLFDGRGESARRSGIHRMVQSDVALLLDGNHSERGHGASW